MPLLGCRAAALALTRIPAEPGRLAVPPPVAALALFCTATLLVMYACVAAAVAAAVRDARLALLLLIGVAGADRGRATPTRPVVRGCSAYTCVEDAVLPPTILVGVIAGGRLCVVRCCCCGAAFL